jgi:hypothetical protein
LIINTKIFSDYENNSQLSRYVELLRSPQIMVSAVFFGEGAA